MVTGTKSLSEAEDRPAHDRDVTFEVAFFCKSCKGHYTSEYRPAPGQPLRCRCGATNIVIYGAVQT